MATPSLRTTVKLAAIALVGAAVARELTKPAEERDWHGTVGGIPYDFRAPTQERVLERWWNTEDERVFTENVFGVGWSINLARVVELLRGGAD